jgi:hypothetical protein
MIRAPSKIIGDEDRSLEIEELLDEPFRNLVDEAATAGWSTPEVLNALEELVRNYRIAYEIDPDPADDPAHGDSGDGNDFGEFPSADSLVKAFVQGRE